MVIAGLLRKNEAGTFRPGLVGRISTERVQHPYGKEGERRRFGTSSAA
jgi:hypothetical protein